MWKSALSFAGLNLVAQLVVLLSIPIVTRLFTTEVFGFFSILISFAMILIPVSSMRLNAAIPITQNDEEAKYIAVAALYSVFFISFLGILFFHIYIHISDISHYDLADYGFLALLILIGGFRLIVHFSELRDANYKKLGVAKFFDGLTVSGSRIGLGVMGLTSVLGLYLAKILGEFAILITLRRNSLRLLRSTRDVSFKEIVVAIKNNYKFIVYSTPGVLLNASSRELSTLLIANLYGVSWAGQFAIASRLLRLPGMSIGKAFSNVVLKESSKVDAVDAEIKTDIKFLLNRLFLGLAPGYISIALSSKLLIEGFLGKEWADTSLVINYTFFYFLIFTCISPILELANSKGKQKIYMIMNAGLFISMVGISIFSNYYNIPVNMFLLAMAVIQSTIYLFSGMYIAGFIGVTVLEYLRQFLPGLIVSLLVYLLFQQILEQGWGGYINLLVSFTLSTLCFAYTVVTMKRFGMKNKQ